MKYFLTFVIVLSVFSTAHVFAGGGGISGGVDASAKYIYVQMCDLEAPTEQEQKQRCRTVRIKNRFTEQDHINAINQKGDCLQLIGEAVAVPCNDKMKTGIPDIIQKLHEAFGGEKDAITAPNQPIEN